MACFVVPAAEAIVVTAAYFIVKHVEKKRAKAKEGSDGLSRHEEEKEPFSKKLLPLIYLLLGGSLLLAFEHLWHGEIVPYFPFLTAATEGRDAVLAVLREMGTVGVAMAALCTLVWGGILLIKCFMARKALKDGENR